MIKENINKIDFDLKSVFEKVDIVEKSTRGNYFFEINAFKNTIDNKKVHVKVEISKPNLNESIIKWSYYPNPLVESVKIERISNIETIANDIEEIVSKRKMNSEYLELLESINESTSFNDDIIEDDTTKSKIQSIIEMFNINIISSENNYDENVLVNTLVLENKLKPSDLYMLDMNLKSAGITNVEYIDNSIKIQIYK